MSVATPEPSSRRHRDSGQHHRSSQRPPSTQTVPTLPEYEAPIVPINAAGKRAITAALQSQTLRHLRAHLQHLEEKLTDAAGDMNERLTDAKVRAEKAQQKRKDEGADDDVEEAGLSRMEEQVKDLTGRMDEKMREAIDSGTKVEAVVTALHDLGEGDEDPESTGPATRRRRQAEDGDGEEEHDDSQAAPVIPALQKFSERLAQNRQSWEGSSLTERYTLSLLNTSNLTAQIRQK